MKRVVVGLLILVLGFPAVVVAAEKKKEVVICAWGGRLEKAMREAWFDPFEKETGIKVISTASPSVSKVKAMVQSGNVEWDLGSHRRRDYDPPAQARPAGEDRLQQIR